MEFSAAAAAAASWWGVLWHHSLTIGALLSFTIGIILLTLPSAYSHFHPRSLTETSFSAPHKKDAKASGYAHFTSRKSRDGHLQFPTSVQVVVLGDIGRSPRMQYHALSIAAHGGLVDLVGYTSSELHPDISRSALINPVGLAPWPPVLNFSNRALFLLSAPFKIVWQTATLYHALAYRTRPSKWILVQNPPSIPTLLVARVVAYFRNARLVVDWHNFGHSILALRLGEGHPVVAAAAWYERAVARGAAAGFCVSDAMARVLREGWGIRALTLHDRPAPIFRALAEGERRGFLAGLPETEGDAVAIREGGKRLVVSSTSWTADEDFGLLIDALVGYSAAMRGSRGAGKRALPEILAIITGRGPLRDHYLRRVEALVAEGKLKGVEVKTAWLSPEDYASLLGAADLGVSLHTSSSGVDLPMKVVDMFGAGLPVAGWRKFEAWGELVQEGVNGRGFESAAQLTEILEGLFGGDGQELSRLREGAKMEGKRRWDDEWMPVAGKLFQLK